MLVISCFFCSGWVSSPTGPLKAANLQQCMSLLKAVPCGWERSGFQAGSGQGNRNLGGWDCW